MNRSLALLGIGLFLGGLTGFMIAAANGITLDGHDHEHGVEVSKSHSSQDAARHDGNHGKMLSLSDGPNAPALDINVIEDATSGWNLHIRTENFRFAPEHASMPHVPGEGHAHVYVNNVKIARHYGPWLHIPKLSPGANVISVTLNTNDHRQLGVDGKPLHAQQTINVQQ